MGEKAVLREVAKLTIYGYKCEQNDCVDERGTELMMYYEAERSAVGRGAHITRHTYPYSAYTCRDAFKVGQLILGRIATMYAVINDCISL